MSRHNHISPIEEIIEEARNGRMFILVDDEDRENEGDLVIPAQMATPAAINFMATHGRGLICLAMARDRIEALELAPMSRSNGARFDTAFTISIEARSGVTTGISAADRARTIATAINAANGPPDLVSPGHVFPIKAKDGGVLIRSGHTEAAVDVARLAGLNPSGVICEIMNDDGTMARLSDLIGFAHRHGLKLGTIRDLVAYRMRHDNLLEKTSELPLGGAYGVGWRAHSYRNRETGAETLLLAKGPIEAAMRTPVRIHTLNIFSDLLTIGDSRSSELQELVKEINAAGRGAIVVLDRPVDGQGIQVSPTHLQPVPDGRATYEDYGTAAQALLASGAEQIVVARGASAARIALSKYDLEVSEDRSTPLSLVPPCESEREMPSEPSRKSAFA